MEEWLKLFKEGLTKLPEMATIEISDNDLLKIHNDSLDGYTDGNIRDLLTKNSKFQSVHDKFVTEKITDKVDGLTTSHNDLLTAKEAELSKLKASIPRPNSPDEIKKRLDAETDLVEKRMLGLELTNALNLEKVSSLEAETKASNKIASNAELLKTLNAHVKDKKYAISDASHFVQYGDKAIEYLDTFGTKQNETLTEMVSAIAKEKYGINPGETGAKPIVDPNAMTYEEIEAKYPGNANREIRIELMEKYKL